MDLNWDNGSSSLLLLNKKSQNTNDIMKVV
jgi:hypothetical protein